MMPGNLRLSIWTHPIPNCFPRGTWQVQHDPVPSSPFPLPPRVPRPPGRARCGARSWSRGGRSCASENHKRVRLLAMAVGYGRQRTIQPTNARTRRRPKQITRVELLLYVNTPISVVHRECWMTWSTPTRTMKTSSRLGGTEQNLRILCWTTQVSTRAIANEQKMRDVLVPFFWGPPPLKPWSPWSKSTLTAAGWAAENLLSTKPNILRLGNYHDTHGWTWM